MYMDRGAPWGMTALSYMFVWRQLEVSETPERQDPERQSLVATCPRRAGPCCGQDQARRADAYGDSAGALKASLLSQNCHNYWLPGVPSCAAERGRGQGNVPLC